MKKIILLFILFNSLNIHSQEQEQDQEQKGTIFYATVERTTKFYEVFIDIFNIYNVEYIQLELYDKDGIEMASNLATLRFKNKKYHIIYNDVEKETDIENIELKLENPNNKVEYPKIVIKLLDEKYNVVDIFKKVFF